MNSLENKKKILVYIAVLVMLTALVVLSILARALLHEESAFAESANPCDGTHTNYTAVSTSGGTISSSGNYYLNGEVSGTIKVTAANVTLCLNGHDINASNVTNARALKIEGNNFTLHDCGRNVRYYKIASDTMLFTFDGATAEDNDGSITGGAIRGGNSGGIFANGISVNLLGGNVVGNYSSLSGSSGAGAYFVNCQTTIHNMNFIGNALMAGYAGGGLSISVNSICSVSANATIKNTVIKQNSAVAGGGLDVSDMYTSDAFNVNVTIEDSVINQNSASRMGGGAALEGSIRISNSRITENTAQEDGGGLNWEGDELSLNNTLINGNSSAGAYDINKGGGLCARQNGKIRFSGHVEIKNNLLKEVKNNFFLNKNIVFDKTDTLSDGSQIGMSFYDDDAASAIANINSENLAYFASDDPTKMIVADGSGGLLYKNKPKITFRADMWDNAGNNTQMFEPNVPFNLNPNPFTKEGHCFLGWSTSAFSGIISYVEKQADVIITTDEDLVLYPVWHENHDGIEFTPVYSLSDIGDSGGNYVITKNMTGDITLYGGTINLCLNGWMLFDNITVSGNARQLIHRW